MLADTRNMYDYLATPVLRLQSSEPFAQSTVPAFDLPIDRQTKRNKHVDDQRCTFKPYMTINLELTDSSSYDEMNHSTHRPARTSKSSRQCSIRFGNVHVNMFPVTLGDNPAVSRGLPLSLDYSAPLTPKTFRIDEYETMREGRPARSMKLSESQRTALLLEIGCPGSRRVQVSKEIYQIKESRKKALANLPPLSLIKLQRFRKMSKSTAQRLRTSEKSNGTFTI